MNRLALVSPGIGSNVGLPPLGLLFLATWVREHTPWWVDIIDCNHDAVEQKLLAGNYDCIGITAMTPQFEAASRLAKKLKAAKSTSVIVGGVHISTAPDSMRPEFDSAIRGEGESALVHILTGKTTAVDLNVYPNLDYRMLHQDYFKPVLSRVWRGRVVEMSLITSRGCPYRCRFCSTSHFWGKYRAHSVDWVIRHLKQLAELGVTHVQIWDDLFTCAKSRLREIATKFEHAGLRSVFKGMACQSRANVIDAEICDLLRSMNVRLVSFGFESGNDKVLESLKVSGAAVAFNKRAVRLVAGKGMSPVGSFMFGVPGETVLQMLQTVGLIFWMARHGVADVWFFVALPYPGTEFWNIAKQRGVLGGIDHNWDKLALRSKWPEKPLLNDIGIWRFRFVWLLAMLAVLPIKLRKVISFLTTH